MFNDKLEYAYTHFARDFNLMQGYDLSDANDASTIKLS